MTTTEDDFWNDSSSSRLNFFDDDDDSSLVESDNYTANVQENITLPIHSLISNKCLKIILDETDSTVEHVVIPAEDIVQRMFHGENCILSTYRSLTQKIQLLDAAIEIGDGNIIVTVILFLSRTLNNNIFFTQLSKRKVAVKHYANYLIEKNSLQEVADLYMATGNTSNMKDIYSLLNKDISNESALRKKLEQFNRHHSQHLYSCEDILEIQDNLALLDFQIANKFKAKSVVDLLINIWDKGGGDEAAISFKKQFKVDDFQFEWALLSTLCRMKNWDKLVATFMKSGWVTKKRALKSVIRPELFIMGVGRHNPPEQVLEQFLSCVSDASKVLYLAEKFKIHMYVVNYHVEQRDKMALLKYMERVEVGNPAIYAIQSNLNNSDIKWKN